MLVISRKENEVVKIGKDIEIIVVKCCDGVVKLGISAPKDVSIFREELLTENN